METETPHSSPCAHELQAEGFPSGGASATSCQVTAGGTTLAPADLIYVCELAELPAGEARPHDVEGYELAFFNTGDDVYAIDRACPHQGASLADGEICGNSVSCPEHGWMIDLLTGQVMERDWAQVATYPVEIVDGKVYVQLG